MPLRDHFRSPVADRTPWEALHGAWPTFIMMDLNRRLPPNYVAHPRVHLGASFEIDVATSERDDSEWEPGAAEDGGGGVAVEVYAPPRPTLAEPTEPPTQDEYEVLIFETLERRLVAAIEIVSPANKDRAENRKAFAAKCASLLRQAVSVSIVDVVTTRRANLYADVMEMIGQGDPAVAGDSPELYAAACRWGKDGRGGRLESWFYPLEVGKSLPTLPLWLAVDLAVPLELEATYAETCRALRIV